MENTKELFFSLVKSGGNVKFNKQKFKRDIETFEKGEKSKVGEILYSSSTYNGEFNTNSSRRSKLSAFVPVQSLDFFGNSKSTQQQQSSEAADEDEENDEQKTSEDNDDENNNSELEDDDDDDEEDSKPSKKKAIQRTEEQVKAIRKEHQISIKGDEVPDPIVQFAELEGRYNIKSYIMKNIANSKYKNPTVVQMQAIPILQEGREALVSAPTGSGKTAAFAIPILSYLKKPGKEGFRALVLAPTRVLAEQIHRDFLALSRGKDWRIRCIEKNFQKAQEKLQSKRNDILIATPKWLSFLIEKGAVNLSNVQRVVLDEADRLFELGFLEQIDAIITACNNPQVVRSLFSATLPMGVEHMAKTFLRDPIRVMVGNRNAGASTITQKLVFCGSEAGKLIALRQKFQDGIQPPVLIFVQSIERAQQLYNELMFDGVNIDYIHGGRSDTQTKDVVNNFRLGKIWVLICTDVMSRGLDFKGVSCVINYDFPTSITSYIHRIGRTGRAGRTGEALTYFSYEDLDMLKNIADVMKNSGCEVPDWMLQMKGLNKEELKVREVQPLKREKISRAVPHNPHDEIFGEDGNNKRKRKRNNNNNKQEKKAAKKQKKAPKAASSEANETD